MIVNDPATLAEVTALVRRYEQALGDNDIATLDAMFWQSDRVIRFGVGECLYGTAEILAFRNILSSEVGSLDATSIRSGGYVMETLTASVWCLLTTSDFSECVLKAVNLGDDTDTTGCVAGGLAGVLYGLEAIPSEWISALPRKDDLRGLFDRFLKLTGTSS